MLKTSKSICSAICIVTLREAIPGEKWCFFEHCSKGLWPPPFYLNICPTRSYAALRAADLDWIIGPGYSLGRVHSGEKPWKTNLEPWKTMETNQKPWKTMKLPWKTMETNQKPWKTLKLRDVTHTGSQLTSMIKKTWRDPHVLLPNNIMFYPIIRTLDRRGAGQE